MEEKEYEKGKKRKRNQERKGNKGNREEEYRKKSRVEDVRNQWVNVHGEMHAGGSGRRKGGRG